MKLFNNNKFRYGLSLCCAFFCALLANHYYAMTTGFLLPITTVYVMQTQIGNAFLQGIKRFILVAVLVLIASMCVFSMRFFYWAMHDVLLGALIGIVANVIIFPRRADIEFRQTVLPLALCYKAYFRDTIELLFDNNRNTGNANMERHFQSLPEWVYELGFDSGLQKGYRFFLMKFEQIGEVLFALHHLARYEYDQELLDDLQLPLMTCKESIDEYLSAIISVLQLKKLTNTKNNLEKDIDELEKKFHLLVPLSLELLDMKRDYVCLAQLIYYFKDLRKLLLKLGETLR